VSKEQWVSVSTHGGPMRAFIAQPPAPAQRAVVVLQEAFGVNANIQDIARRFASHGYLAIAPDLFHRSGIEELPYSDHARAVATISQIGAAAILDDVSATLTHLRDSHGIVAQRVALVGFCFGGRAAFTAATSLPDLGAAVVFYGPGVAAGPHAVLDRAAGIRAPMLLHVGAEDPTIPKEHVAATALALSEAGARFTQHLYPDAGHAFANDARPANYREGAAATAWERTFTFLNSALPQG
jgi:carboxymethylenebutenolidase